MSKPLVRRLIVVLILSAFLGSPASSWAGPRSHSAARPSRHQTAVRSPLSWLWNTLVSGREKEGCRIDPNGRCLAVSPQQTADAGCSADPYGQCLPGH